MIKAKSAIFHSQKYIFSIVSNLLSLHSKAIGETFESRLKDLERYRITHKKQKDCTQDIELLFNCTRFRELACYIIK